MRNTVEKVPRPPVAGPGCRVDGERRRVLVHHEPQRAEARGEVGRDRDRDRHGGGVRSPARQGQLNRAVRGALGHATVEQRGLQVLPALQPARRRRGVDRLSAAAHGRERGERGGAQDDGAPAEAAGRGAHAGNSVSKVGGRARRDRQRYGRRADAGARGEFTAVPSGCGSTRCEAGGGSSRAFPRPRGRAPAAAPARPPRSRRRSGGLGRPTARSSALRRLARACGVMASALLRATSSGFSARPPP